MSGPRQRYEFRITLAGYGSTPEEAWDDAIESFYDDSGSTPCEEDYDIIDEVIP